MRTLTCKTALLSLALLSPAWAQEAADDSPIAVTATRTPTPIERLPARIEVIDREDFEARGLITLTEAIGGEAVQAGGGGQQASVFLRGANSKHTLALFDGVRVNDASTPNAQYDFGLDTLGGLDRVEVLRGPASAIYGSDAIGGVVNLIPRRGGASAFEPFLEAAAGSFDTLRGLLGAAGSTDTFEYGISAEVQDSEGFDLVPERMNMRTGDPDGTHIATLVASVRADLGAFAVDGLLRTRQSEVEFDTFSGGLSFSLRADDPDLENEATQNLWRVGAELDASEALRFRVSGGQVLSDRSETDGGFTTNAAEARQSFIDANAHYARGNTNLTAAVWMEREEINTLSQFADPLATDEEQHAAYLIGQTRLGERFDATASVRIDDYESFGTQTTYALGVVGNFAPVRVFASYGTAFKAPSLSERFETSLFNIGNPDLAPEDSQTWEIGADWDALGEDRLTLGASLYQTRIDNLIEYDFAALQNINIGRAAIDGAEAYVDAAPVSWGSLRLAYAYTDARNDITGGQLLRRPEQFWRLDASVNPTERLGLALRWTFLGERADVTYDDNGDFLSGAGRVEAFNVGAVSATFDLDQRAQLFARINNLTDETYEQPAAFAGEPRSGMLGIRARN